MAARDSAGNLILLAAVFGFIVVCVFLWWSRKGKGDAVLILGPMDAGKTVLFYQLKQGLFRDTHTSMIENIASFIPTQLSEFKKLPEYQYIDLPGHGNLRWKVASFLPRARGLIYVIDSSNGQQIPHAAQQLFEILSGSTAVNKVPLLIACNKSDNEGALTADEIKRRLERELEKCRTHQHTMADLQDESHAKPLVTLGKSGISFRFEHCANGVRFGTISTKTGSIRPVTEFITTLSR